MKIISDYILDLKPYPITMNAMEKTLESPTLKEVLEKNLLRGEIIDGGRYTDTATYSVYYNSNGNKCKYINGEITEIENSGGE